MALTLTDIQKVDLAVQPVDAAGNAALVDGACTWESSDVTVLTVEPAADGLSAVALTTGKLGTAQIKCTADADLTEGVLPILGVLDVEVVASAAVSVAITAGAPVNK